MNSGGQQERGREAIKVLDPCRDVLDHGIPTKGNKIATIFCSCRMCNNFSRDNHLYWRYLATILSDRLVLWLAGQQRLFVDNHNIWRCVFCSPGSGPRRSHGIPLRDDSIHPFEISVPAALSVQFPAAPRSLHAAHSLAARYCSDWPPLFHVGIPARRSTAVCSPKPYHTQSE